MDFFNSKFMKDLGNGNLPIIKIEIEHSSIIALCIGLLTVAVIIMLIHFLMKK